MKSYEQEIVRIISGKLATEADLEMVTQTNEEEQVEEAAGAPHPMALHVKPVNKNGKPMYQVHAVGKSLSDGIKVGEHLSDTELDDATEMGAKIKHIKEDSDEEVDFTVIEHKAFVYDFSDRLTFANYIDAAKRFTENEQDAIAIADKFFRENDDSIVLESFTRADVEERANNWGKAGHQVSLPKYTTKDGKLHAEYTVTNKDTGQKTKYIYHGTKRSVEKN